MIDCTRFRATFAPATESPEILEHLRQCDACLDFAVHSDPDVMFRAIGGDDLMPPGGLDAFVGEVMREVRVRDTETLVTRHEPWYRRLAVAAAITVAVSAGALFMVRENRAVAPVMTVARATTRPAMPVSTRPVIESYESQNATIVEVPTEGAGDVKVVMIFDETLPADL